MDYLEFTKEMKPFIVLLGAFVISLFVILLIHGHYDVALAARIAMSIMLGLTAIGHFLYPKGMKMMIPGPIPFKPEIVFLTGILEIVLAITLHIPVLKCSTGWALIIFFIVMLPANINAAVNRVDYQKGTLEGPGLNYLWFRVPLQIIFILWTYYSVLN